MRLAQTMANTMLNTGAGVYVEPLALLMKVLEAVAVVAQFVDTRAKIIGAAAAEGALCVNVLASNISTVSMLASQNRSYVGSPLAKAHPSK